MEQMLIINAGLLLATICLLVAAFLLNRGSSISLREGKKLIVEMKKLQKEIGESIRKSEDSK